MLEVLRKEIKYLVPIERFLILKKKLELVMEKDKHGDDGSYRVRTQYFDSLNDQDLFDNLHGVEEKRKIRVRIYSPDTDRAKLEYKCKSNLDSRKMSITISREEAIEMEKGRFSFLLNRDEELAIRLYIKIMQNAYRPKTIVEYSRMAYAYPISDLRITFDTFLRGTVDPYGLFNKELASIPLLNEDLGVLEIKYNGFIPSPFRSIVQEIDNIPEALSKYSLSRLLI